MSSVSTQQAQTAWDAWWKNKAPGRFKSPRGVKWARTFELSHSKKEDDVIVDERYLSEDGPYLYDYPGVDTAPPRLPKWGGIVDSPIKRDRLIRAGFGEPTTPLPSPFISDVSQTLTAPDDVLEFVDDFPEGKEEVHQALKPQQAQEVVAPEAFECIFADLSQKYAPFKLGKNDDVVGMATTDITGQVIHLQAETSACISSTMKKCTALLHVFQTSPTTSAGPITPEELNGWVDVRIPSIDRAISAYDRKVSFIAAPPAICADTRTKIDNDSKNESFRTPDVIYHLYKYYVELVPPFTSQGRVPWSSSLPYYLWAPWKSGGTRDSLTRTLLEQWFADYKYFRTQDFVPENMTVLDNIWVQWPINDPNRVSNDASLKYTNWDDGDGPPILMSPKTPHDIYVYKFLKALVEPLLAILKYKWLCTTNSGLRANSEDLGRDYFDALRKDQFKSYLFEQSFEVDDVLDTSGKKSRGQKCNQMLASLNHRTRTYLLMYNTLTFAETTKQVNQKILMLWEIVKNLPAYRKYLEEYLQKQRKNEIPWIRYKDVLGKFNERWRKEHPVDVESDVEIVTPVEEQQVEVESEVEIVTPVEEQQPFVADQTVEVVPFTISKGKVLLALQCSETSDGHHVWSGLPSPQPSTEERNALYYAAKSAIKDSHLPKNVKKMVNDDIYHHYFHKDIRDLDYDLPTGYDIHLGDRHIYLILSDSLPNNYQLKKLDTNNTKIRWWGWDEIITDKPDGWRISGKIQYWWHNPVDNPNECENCVKHCVPQIWSKKVLFAIEKDMKLVLKELSKKSRFSNFRDYLDISKKVNRPGQLQRICKIYQQLIASNVLETTPWFTEWKEPCKDWMASLEVIAEIDNKNRGERQGGYLFNRGTTYTDVKANFAHNLELDLKSFNPAVGSQGIKHYMDKLKEIDFRYPSVVPQEGEQFAPDGEGLSEGEDDDTYEQSVEDDDTYEQSVEDDDTYEQSVEVVPFTIVAGKAYVALQCSEVEKDQFVWSGIRGTKLSADNPKALMQTVQKTIKTSKLPQATKDQLWNDYRWTYDYSFVKELKDDTKHLFLIFTSEANTANLTGNGDFSTLDQNGSLIRWWPWDTVFTEWKQSGWTQKWWKNPKDDPGKCATCDDHCVPWIWSTTFLKMINDKLLTVQRKIDDNPIFQLLRKYWDIYGALSGEKAEKLKHVCNVYQFLIRTGQLKNPEDSPPAADDCVNTMNALESISEIDWENRGEGPRWFFGRGPMTDIEDNFAHNLELDSAALASVDPLTNLKIGKLDTKEYIQKLDAINFRRPNVVRPSTSGDEFATVEPVEISEDEEPSTLDPYIHALNAAGDRGKENILKMCEIYNLFVLQDEKGQNIPELSITTAGPCVIYLHKADYGDIANNLLTSEQATDFFSRNINLEPRVMDLVRKAFVISPKWVGDLEILAVSEQIRLAAEQIESSEMSEDMLAEKLSDEQHLSNQKESSESESSESAFAVNFGTSGEMSEDMLATSEMSEDLTEKPSEHSSESESSESPFAVNFGRTTSGEMSEDMLATSEMSEDLTEKPSEHSSIYPTPHNPESLEGQHGDESFSEGQHGDETFSEGQPGGESSGDATVQDYINAYNNATVNSEVNRAVKLSKICSVYTSFVDKLPKDTRPSFTKQWDTTTCQGMGTINDRLKFIKTLDTTLGAKGQKGPESFAKNMALPLSLFKTLTERVPRPMNNTLDERISSARFFKMDVPFS